MKNLVTRPSKQTLEEVADVLAVATQLTWRVCLFAIALGLMYHFSRVVGQVPISQLNTVDVFAMLWLISLLVVNQIDYDAKKRKK